MIPRTPTSTPTDTLFPHPTLFRSAPDPKDKRFMDPAWQFNPFFRAGAQYYLAVQKGMRGWLEDLDLDELERDRANFITTIIIDSLAPTNTLAGNPTDRKSTRLNSSH